MAYGLSLHCFTPLGRSKSLCTDCLKMTGVPLVQAELVDLTQLRPWHGEQFRCRAGPALGPPPQKKKHKGSEILMHSSRFQRGERDLFRVCYLQKGTLPKSYSLTGLINFWFNSWAHGVLWCGVHPTMRSGTCSTAWRKVTH